ncbi:Ig-like domain-containing protein [Brevibacillus ginsengisoli]|uniref:Ig-like domain-containing protein n=1 Tax=Brevibacillus ginsengisoli TaxID=363854 RepID=UPI003CECC787
MSGDPTILEAHTLRTMEETTVYDQLFPTTDDTSTAYGFQITSQPQNGIADVHTDGLISYTPYEEFVGTDLFTIQVEDSHGVLTRRTIRVHVDPVPDEPARLTKRLLTYTNTPICGSIVSENSNKKPCTCGIASVPNEGTVILHSDGHFVYTPYPNFRGTDRFSAYITDTKGEFELGNITINIHERNCEPNCEPIPETCPKPTPKPSLELIPVAIENCSSATETITPIDDSNRDSLEQVEDRVVYHESQSRPSTSWDIGISKPVQNWTVCTDEGVPIQGSVRKNRGRNHHTFDLIQKPKHGAIQLKKQGKWTYEPNEGYVGMDRFLIRVTDGEGRSSIAQVTVFMKETDEE